jgi:acetyl-CoA synthetase
LNPHAITTLSVEQQQYEPTPDYKQGSRVPSRAAYDALYRESLAQPEQFWARETRELVFRTPHERLLETDPPFA